MKVIDLKKRTIYVDDIEQIYIDDSFDRERYIIQTRHGIYPVDREDYFKVKDCLLSLNDEVKVIEEDKKIRKITLLGEEIKLGSLSNWLKDYTNNEEEIASCIECNAMKINEIIDKVNKGE